MLLIKHLGDFTTEVVPKVEEGTQLKIEGSYGCFTPDFQANSQTWIATGIGIAPFLAWLRAAAEVQTNDVTLHWCIKDASKEPLLPEVKTACETAGVKLTVHESRRARATVAELLAEDSERLAVCGNGRLASDLRKAWRGHPSNFQTEHFQWRHAGP